ncbi:MAG: flavodoxin family protein [Dehalococcoidia bacterium]|nr:flavodoxin family protein [Dehalococcoidia bacterium]
MTKVVAVNGSAMMDNGNTHLILEPFLEGLKETGAEVELFYTRKLDIKPCQGGFICWNKTPGECWQKDDMACHFGCQRKSFMGSTSQHRSLI